MPATKARIRKLALALDGASEVVHVDRPAFRTKRKIFATLPPDAQAVNLMFDAATQEFFCEQAPHAIAPYPGGWGRMGVTICDLKAADETLAHSALKAAHALAAPKPKPRKRKGGEIRAVSLLHTRSNPRVRRVWRSDCTHLKR